jgi:hypothetical protein
MTDPAFEQLKESGGKMIDRLDRAIQFGLDHLEDIPEYKAKAEARKLSIYVEKHPEINLNDPSLPN